MPGRADQDSATAERLLEAAAEEFARHGYAAARIRDIVETAGTNLAAVNYYFGGKEALYRATLAALARRAQDDLPAQSPELLALPPEDRLRAMARVMIGRYLGAGRVASLSAVIAHELLDPTPAFGQVVRDVTGPQWERLRGIVARLLGPRASGEDVDLATLSIAGQWAFFLYGRRMFEALFADLASRPDAVDRLANHIADFSIAAMRARRAQLESQGAEGAAAKPGRARGTSARTVTAARPRRPGRKAGPASR